MKKIIVRYKLKPGREEENLEHIEAVFRRLDTMNPEGFRYAVFRQADGVSFEHIASVETADGSNPLAEMEEFQAFTRDIDSRCKEKPKAYVVEELGDFRMFDR